MLKSNLHNCCCKHTNSQNHSSYIFICLIIFDAVVFMYVYFPLAKVDKFEHVVTYLKLYKYYWRKWARYFLTNGI